MAMIAKPSTSMESKREARALRAIVSRKVKTPDTERSGSSCPITFCTGRASEATSWDDRTMMVAYVYLLPKMGMYHIGMLGLVFVFLVFVFLFSFLLGGFLFL